MSWVRNLPLSQKFTYAFGLVCALCLVLGIYTFFTFRGIAQKSAEVSGNHLPSLIHIADIRNGVNVERREDLELMLCQTPECKADHTARRQKAIADYRETLKDEEPLVSSAERSYYQTFVASITQYQDASDRAIALLTAGKAGQALDLLSSDAMMGWMNDAVSATENGVRLHAKIATEESGSATAASGNAAWVNIAVTLLIVVLCALTGMVLTRVTAPRMVHLSELLRQVAAKDLTTYAMVTGTDEIGLCGTTLNSLTESIRGVMRSVAQGAETLSAATTEISAQAVQSAGNARTESSKINQIAAAAQEMTATIGEISHNAENAAGSAASRRRQRSGAER